MSVVNATGTTGLGSVARELMRTFDRNKDGQLSTDEFSTVLTTMMQSLSSPNAGGSSPAGTGTFAFAPTVSTPAAASTSSASSSSSTSSTTPPRTDHLSGFVASKLETSQSTKYKFGRAAMGFDLSSVKDKASAEDLLKQMKPAMEREGLEVLEISKDKIKVMHEGAPIWVDVIRAAASGINTAFQWLPE